MILGYNTSHKNARNSRCDAITTASVFFVSSMNFQNDSYLSNLQSPRLEALEACRPTVHVHSHTAGVPQDMLSIRLRGFHLHLLRLPGDALFVRLELLLGCALLLKYNTHTGIRHNDNVTPRHWSYLHRQARVKLNRDGRWVAPQHLACDPRLPSPVVRFGREQRLKGTIAERARHSFRTFDACGFLAAVAHHLAQQAP